MGMDKIVRVKKSVPANVAPVPQRIEKPVRTEIPQKQVENQREVVAPSNMNVSGSYLIRLASYGDLSNFDANKIMNIGTLTTRKSGDYTVVLLEGYPNLAAAQKRLPLAIKAGFADAHIVQETADGTLKKVK